MTGRLSLVGTPIGNLGDITFRAVERLKAVSRIYAEDTRRTRVLLDHLGIEGKRVLSLHAHSSMKTIQTAVEILSGGDDVALVTDAGMPSVSDPGTELVRAAREAGLIVDVIPGPSAVTSAVALSGLVDGPFSFYGFLPRKGTKRKQVLSQLERSALPVVLFESPHRITETLEDLCRECGPSRQIAICRELTKKFEETIVHSLGEVSAPGFRDTWQGEFTLVLEANPHPSSAEENEDYDVDERARTLLAQGNSVKDTAHTLSKELGRRGEKTSRRELYGRVLALGSDAEDEGDTAPPRGLVGREP